MLGPHCPLESGIFFFRPKAQSLHAAVLSLHLFLGRGENVATVWGHQGLGLIREPSVPSEGSISVYKGVGHCPFKSFSKLDQRQKPRFCLFDCVGGSKSRGELRR